jgi:hypothetical protein
MRPPQAGEPQAGSLPEFVKNVHPSPHRLQEILKTARNIKDQGQTFSILQQESGNRPPRGDPSIRLPWEEAWIGQSREPPPQAIAFGLFSA